MDLFTFAYLASLLMKKTRGKEEERPGYPLFVADAGGPVRSSGDKSRDSKWLQGFLLHSVLLLGHFLGRCQGLVLTANQHSGKMRKDSS